MPSLCSTRWGEFGISTATVGLVITITQIGYGLGLLLLVPLGDLLNRRRLIVGQSLLSVFALLTVAAAPTGTILLAGMAAVGLLAVVTQVLVAYAAALAHSNERGGVVGTVTSGIIIGILLARTVSGTCLTCSAGDRSISRPPRQRSSSRPFWPKSCRDGKSRAHPSPMHGSSDRWSRCWSKSRCCAFAPFSRC